MNSSRILPFILLLIPAFSFGQLVKLKDFGSSNGKNTFASVVTDGTFLYGTTIDGGANDHGVVYKVKPDGSEFTTLHAFNETDGAEPYGTLLLKAGVLFGTTYRGGANLAGTIFKINTDGSGFTTLFEFEDTPTGAFPVGALIADPNSSTILYGVTSQGGTGSLGTVYKINTDGTGHTKLLEFNGTNGSNPNGVITDGVSLFGMTLYGGTNFNGTGFRIDTDGNNYKLLIEFNNSTNGSSPFGNFFFDGTYLWGLTELGGANNSGTLFRIVATDGSSYQRFVDFGSGIGSFPKGSLISDGSVLLGTTTQGGLNGYGTIFKIDFAGNNFATVIDLQGDSFGAFTEGTLTRSGTTLFLTRSSGGFSRLGNIFKVSTSGTGAEDIFSFEQDGLDPTGELISDGTYLYGVTNTGGHYAQGTIYKIKPDGTDFQRLLDFNEDVSGSRPIGEVFLIGSTLYGMTSEGGANNYGVIYSINTDGTNFQVIMDFNFTNTGGYPTGGFVYDGTYLYGMTPGGGVNSEGVIFKILPNGTDFTKLHDFADATDGSRPQGTLLLQSGVLYGITQYGGTHPSGSPIGTIFKIETNGSNFEKIGQLYYDVGGQSHGSLYSDGTFLYGLTALGGAHSSGTIFKLRPDGSDFGVIMDFADDESTGSAPQGSFIGKDGYLYAVTSGRGVENKGTIFKVKSDGTGFAKLEDFNDGDAPLSKLYSDGTFMYGVTNRGGNYSRGTLFKRSFAAHASVTDFFPKKGLVGTYVTILGNEFDPVAANNIVKFNGVNAKVVSAKTDTIIAIVPDAAVTGIISVTVAGGTDDSLDDFEVTPDAEMYNGKLQTCDATFLEPRSGGYDDIIETMIPATPGGKIRVVFNSMNIGDGLYVYDGPDTTAATLITMLSDGDTEFEYTSTAPGGELTFRWVWFDSGTSFDATITCNLDGVIIVDPQPVDAAVCPGLTATFTTAASNVPNITYQWQFSNDGVNWNDIADGGGYSNTTTAMLSVNTTGNFGAGNYRARINGDGAVERTTDAAALVINPAPAAPTGGGSTEAACVSTATLVASGGTDGQYRWYTVATGGQAIDGAVNGTFTTPSLTTSTDYFAAITNGQCESTRVTFSVNVTCATEVVVYNAVSPNGDGKNDYFLLEFIDVLPDTKDNVVKIYNRWGEEVFTVRDYNNRDHVFSGNNKHGNKLPSGTYYYRVTFPVSGTKELEGYLEIRN